ncbi:MAG: hypothetical protein L6N95_02540, partial [Candidatus Methylarchaceae archaeon HK01B]|nr:hypothetical protein [Candidatus Methylarchaceae archaeon HK01B]
MNSNRKLSITIISILILSAFTTATAPITSAIGDPYITVYPSSVKPGQTVYVRGYNFERGETVEIYCDIIDEYHHLGSADVNWYGRFYFSFVMQESYPGTCNIIAVTNPDGTYSEDIELSYTNPLDQRLVDLIGSQSIDIEAKLDTILERIGTPGSAPLDTVFNALSAIYDELTTDIANTGRTGWTDLASALDDIKGEIVTIDGIVDSIWGAVDTMEADLESWMTTNLKTNIDNIWGKVDTEIDAIMAKTDTINWADINNIGNWLNGWFGSGGKYSSTEQIYVRTDAEIFWEGISWHDICHGDSSPLNGKPAKMTITIRTNKLNQPDEWLEIYWEESAVWALEGVAHGRDMHRTFEFCFHGDVSLKGSTTDGFEAWYTYVVE